MNVPSALDAILELKVEEMAALVRGRELSSVELVEAHLRQIERVNPHLNAAVEVLVESAFQAAQAADDAVRRREPLGRLHGVPFSVKDSIDVAGSRCTAGTVGFRNAPCASRDATLVHRLRREGGIPIAKTNLPDLLFSFETDNLIFGRTNNPYDISRSSGGSSGGEAALIAACCSPLGLGSDCAGSVRLPAAFCGIAGIKPTSGRLPRTGHVPPAGGWIEKLWQIGPMARHSADVRVAMEILAGADGMDLSCPPVPLSNRTEPVRIAFFTNNGIAECTSAVRDAVTACALRLQKQGLQVEEKCPPMIEMSYELELAILGADGGVGIDTYLSEIGSDRVHPFLVSFVDRTRPFRATAAEFATRWAQWDAFRGAMTGFFQEYDAVLSPVYADTASPHGASMNDHEFAGFSYTMSWNVAGFPAATVRCGEDGALPIGVQIITKPWDELRALDVCALIEADGGGWKAPHALDSLLESQ